MISQQFMDTAIVITEKRAHLKVRLLRREVKEFKVIIQIMWVKEKHFVTK